MNKLSRRVLPGVVFVLSAFATLAMADYPYPPSTWGACAGCEPYSHSDATAGGCSQCCEDCRTPHDDGSSLFHCLHCCNVRNGGDPNKEPHCVASTTVAETDSEVL